MSYFNRPIRALKYAPAFPGCTFNRINVYYLAIGYYFFFFLLFFLLLLFLLPLFLLVLLDPDFGSSFFVSPAGFSEDSFEDSFAESSESASASASSVSAEALVSSASDSDLAALAGTGSPFRSSSGSSPVNLRKI